jgi:hypothetical protein
MTHNLRNVQNFVAALQPNMKIAQFGSYSTLPEYKLAVGKFVAVKASDFNKFQQLSKRRSQQVQYQSLAVL